MMTRIHDRPKVSGTNRKWNSAVAPNWSRERFTTSRSGIIGIRDCFWLWIHRPEDVRRDRRHGHFPAHGIGEPRVPDHVDQHELDGQRNRDLESKTRPARATLRARTGCDRTSRSHPGTHRTLSLL